MFLCADGHPLYIGDSRDYLHLRRIDNLKLDVDGNNPITVLNEIYYGNVVYTYRRNRSYAETEYSVRVVVDDVIGYGRGMATRDAKENAARAAVRQLRASGRLQQRLAEKELNTKLRDSAGGCYVNLNETVGSS